ncbi:unnamed protein product [Pleuronectes platessa]|uniref:Uncharacterized protein n=1 Tax=Pleuronectes platessa TaxID=8262 RepID=A0A9N7YSI6_PLEPL|nr:unnamed protein product [Pleuronectes platessa]
MPPWMLPFYFCSGSAVPSLSRGGGHTPVPPFLLPSPPCPFFHSQMPSETSAGETGTTRSTSGLLNRCVPVETGGDKRVPLSGSDADKRPRVSTGDLGPTCILMR